MVINHPARCLELSINLLDLHMNLQYKLLALLLTPASAVT